MNENTKEINNFDEVYQKSGSGKVYKDIIDYIEKPLIEWALKKSDGNQIKAAKILGINRNTIRVKIKKFGIAPRAFK